MWDVLGRFIVHEAKSVSQTTYPARFNTQGFAQITNPKFEQ